MKYLDLSDPDYVLERKKLIPHAMAFANRRLDEVLSKETDTETRNLFWDKLFHRQMDIMAFEAGLTSWRPK